MQRPSRRGLVATLAATALLASCSGGATDEPATGDAAATAGAAEGSGTDRDAVVEGLSPRQQDHLVEDGETTWDVTYTDDTTVVDGDGLAALQQADDAKGTYTFDTAAAEAAGLDLAEGRVLLVAGRALRRITGVEQGDGTTRVASEPASLADAVQDGTVAWDVPIDFGFDRFVTAAGDSGPSALGPTPGPDAVQAAGGRVQLARVATRMPDGRVVPVQSGGDIAKEVWDSIEVDQEAGQVSWTYTAQGNTYQFRLTSRGDAVDVLVVVSRPAEGDPKMAFRGEGTIEPLRSSASTTFAGGEVASSDIGIDRLSSDLDLSLAVAGAGASPVDFTVPVPMLTYTWLVGPVPVTLDLTTEIIGNVNAQANAAAEAEASFSYRGDAGFAFEGAEVSASGNTAISEMDPEPADSSAGMGIDVDAQFGVGFPHVSLSILGQGLVPELRAGAVIGSSLQWGGPAAGFPASSLCKEAYVRMEVSGGYDFTVLGQSLGGDEFTLYEDENRTQGDSCPDE